MLDKFISQLSVTVILSETLFVSRRIRARRANILAFFARMLIRAFGALPYFNISTKCGTFATMPRIAELSGRSITWFNRVNPNPLITSFCFTGAQIAEITHFR
jgi:hypothetical protein